MSVRNLEALFQPASVAVIGASDYRRSIGSLVLRNLKRGGFKGPIWPVNSRHVTVDGGPAWTDIASLPQAPDLAVICTRPSTVPDLIAALGRKGTRAAIVLTAGLKQPSLQGGPSLEQAMVEAARPYLLRILGPNCIGALVPGVSLNASFAPGDAKAGRLAFVTQSGALATTMLDWANSRNVGFSHFISLGDSADVDFGDVLDYLASDAQTRAILMCAESFKSARKFMSAARAAARNKPVIVVKAGRTPGAARAAAAHAGALAGSDAVVDAAIRRAGMLRVDTLESLFDAAETLARARPWCGERLAILTNGGGAGVLAADALQLGGGTLARLSEQTMGTLDQWLPTGWSHGNPIDILGDAPVDRYQDALRVLLAAPEVDAVLFMHAPTAIVPAAEIASACLPLIGQSAKPVLTCWLGGGAAAAALVACDAASIANYNTPERAAAAWLQLVNHARNQATLQQLPAEALEDFTPDRPRAQSLHEQALKDGHEWLDKEQALALLRAYGVPVAENLRAGDTKEAVAAMDRIGYPDAHELIVGIATDAVFGPVVLLGEGGVAVEMRKDLAVALPPLNANLASDMITRSRLAPLLADYRGHPAADEKSLVDILLKVSQMTCDLPWLAELDINPLLVSVRGVLAMDAHVRLRPVAAGEGSRLAICPYPSALEEHIEMAGHDLLARPIRPEDGQRLMDFYAKASPADMRLRFFMARREVPHSELARYSQIDYDREMTFIALATMDSGERFMVGEVRAACDPDNVRAEFAIQLASSWQGKGLGQQLLDKLIRYLRERGTAEVMGQCMAENLGMAALARRCGFEVSVEPSQDTMALHLRLR